MRVGTASLLFGVHQVFYHPVLVLRAWHHLYGWPSWRELICIMVHDWGYWGKAWMDNQEGETHPELGAKIVGWLFGPHYHDLVLYHSRHYARRYGAECSPLCWADKLSILYDPRWFYLLRARLSGELAEYRERAHRANVVDISASDEAWFAVLRDRFERVAREQRNILRTNPE